MRILANLNVAGTLDIDTVTNAAADTDRFLVQDANGVVRYRTGAEVASDIGAAVGFVSTLKHEVKLSVAVGKGKAVYISGSDGTNMLASLASNASEATSTKTLGLTESAGAQNAKVFVVSEGLLAGLDTSTATIGDPVWLGVDGELIYGLANKPYAPDHMVFVGLVTRVNANNGEIFVKVQNGFELQELHNVQITTTPANNTVLAYETSSSLYKMKSIATLLGYTPADDAGVVHLAGTETITGTKTFTAATTTFAKVVANSPTGGATGEGLVVGSSFKLDASGVGQSAKIYVVTKDLSDTYGSGLQIQFANIDDNKGFGFNLNTAGGYELYTKDAGAAWVKAMTVSNAQLATFHGNVKLANYTSNGFVKTSSSDGTISIDTTSYQPTSEKGQINGYASLDGGGKVPSSQLPSYVDDVVEYANLAGFPATGETGKIYVALDTNKIYRWSGTAYVEVSPTVGTVWGGITGTLSNQTDLQSALDAKVPTTREITINGTTYDLSANRTWTIPAGVSGSGTANQLVYWNGSSSVAGSTFLTLNLTADNGYLILTGGATYKNADIWLNRYSDAWENAIRFQTNGTTDWYLGSSATGSNSNLEFFSYGTSSAALTLLRSNANANFGASVGIGNTTLTGYSLRVSRTMVGDTASGITSFGVVSDGIVQSAVTSGAFGFNSSLSTAAAAFTLDSLIHFRATQGTIGNTSAVTNQYGFAALGTMTGATNNYGFFGSLDSATGRWNLYMSGTARNYLAGDTSIGTTTGGYKLNVSGTANISGVLTGTTGTFSSTLTGTGLRSYAVNTAQTPSNNAGWYTLARFNTYAPFLNTNGNSGIITLSFYGGGIYTPSRYRIFYFKDDANVATLKLEKYGAVDYIQEVRIRYRTGDTRYYIEIYCDSHASGLTFDVHHDRLFGYGDQLEIFGGVLDAVSGTGTILATLPFVDHGTTVSSLNVVTSASFSSSLTANSFVKSGGIASQFLKADGTVDSNTYLTSYTETDTLASVTGRGATTATSISVTGGTLGKSSPSITAVALKLTGQYDQLVIRPSDDTLQSYYTLVIQNSAGTTDLAGITKAGGGIFASSLTASSFVKTGGTSSQFLKADGSVDSNTYVTGGPYLPLTGGTLTNTGGDNTPILSFVGSSTDTWQWITRALNSSLAAGKNIGHWVGKAASSKNSGSINFQWNADQDNTNFLHLGLYGVNYILKLYGDGSSEFTGALKASMAALGSAASTFVVSDSGTLKSRTAAQVRSDIGAAASSDLSSYVTIGTDQTITGIKTFANTASDTLIIFGTDAAGLQDQGATFYMGGNNGQNNARYAVISALKANGTSGNSEGYLKIGIRSASSGIRDAVTINAARDVSIVGNVTAASIIKSGGTASQFLKADGSVDTTTYLTVETDTLSSVTGRGASTSTNLTFNGTLTMGTSGTQYIRMGRFPASTSNTGEAWIGRASDRSAGIMTVQLGGSSNGSFFEIVDHAWSVVTFKAGVNDFSYKGNTIYHSGNLTNLNQLTNGPGYITSYTETDTLSSVVARGASTSTGITINPNGTSITMGGGASAEGIRMQATNSTTYPVFLRAVNPTGGGETSPWLYKEDSTPWGIWHNNPINSIDFTRATATGIENNVGGGTNTVMIRLDMSGGNGQFTGSILNRTGTAILDQSGNTTGNAATATSATRVVTIQDAVPSGVNGQLWWESDTGKLKVYYGTASAWVDATAIPDMSLYFTKAGGTISGDVSIQQTLTVSGNTLVLGTINATGDVIAYSSSDIKLKDNISAIELPLEKIAKINGVSFNWNDKQSVYEVGKRDYGVIAQEVENVLPELVTTRDNGYKAVRYEKIVALLIEAIKEQQIQIKELNKTVINLSQNFNSL